MPIKDLREHYRLNGRSRQALNHAIRAECPGGDEALDALTLIKQMLDRHGWEEPSGAPTPLAVAYQRLEWVVAAMERDVRERWEMPARPE